METLTTSGIKIGRSKLQRGNSACLFVSVHRRTQCLSLSIHIQRQLSRRHLVVTEGWLSMTLPWTGSPDDLLTIHSPPKQMQPHLLSGVPVGVHWGGVSGFCQTAQHTPWGILNRATTNSPVKKDPISPLERNMNSMLLSLKWSDRLPDGVYSYLRSSGGSTPQLYGLPKVHKQDVPLRSIVSLVSSPTYRFLANLLAPVVGQSCSHVRNSKDFAEFISQQALREDEIMVSFDVVSLFTCVPTDLAVQIARGRLEKDPTVPERTELLVDDTVNLLTLCLNATFLEIRGKVYQQVHGTAMGSPVSVVIANLVMEDVEQRALATFHSPPRF